MKRLVLCCDGTWNRADQEKDDVPCPTNVVKLAYRVAKRGSDGVLQIVYYDQGVGTGNVVDRISGGAIGKGLEANIYDAYRFLVGNYEPGDEIYLFGFSRGAFTARSIAGMVRKCGILKRECVKEYRRAIDLYHSDKRPTDDEPMAFRASNCVVGEPGVRIRMIGVWDTVGSLGIPLRGLRWLTRRKYTFHDTELSGAVENAFHALAVDERRAPFEPTLWYFKPKPPQRVEQVWFCGAHSDVGGGYTETALSDIALDWMLEKAAETGLHVDATVRRALPTNPDPMGKLHNSKTGLYRVTPGDDRLIGMRVAHEGGTDEKRREPDPTQTLHSSVLARWHGDPSYRPQSLKDYFRRNPSALAAPGAPVPAPTDRAPIGV